MRKNTKLGDESKIPISCRLDRADYDIETEIDEVFANMDDGMNDMEDQQNKTKLTCTI